MANKKDIEDLLFNELLSTSGYDVDCAIGMTYSLDLEALLSVPLAFGMLGELDETTRQSPLYLLEAVRKSADKILIYCNKGGIKIPSQSRTVYSLLENSICEICHKEQPLSNFHPKLWIIQETNRVNKEDRQTKVIVLSRNLTFDNSLDIAVSMTGKIQDVEVDCHKQQPLIYMLETMLPHTKKEKRPLLRKMMEALRQVETFDLNNEFEDYDFLPMMPDTQKLNTDINFQRVLQGKRMQIISPFIDKPTLDWLNDRLKSTIPPILFTRKESVTGAIFDEYTSKGGEIYVMKNAMTDNDVAGIDLHAKMYYVGEPKDACKNYLFLGSANATQAGFSIKENALSHQHVNTEFLLRLTYRRSINRAENFKALFINEDKDCKFEQLLYPPTTEEQTVAKYTISERVLKDILANGRLSAKAIETTKGLYDVRIHRKSINAKGCTFRISPMQMATMSKPFDDIVLFERIPIYKLSEFYILSVYDGEKTTDCVVKITTKGMPSDRDAQIFKSYIDTEEKFLKYISLMLTDTPNKTLAELLQPEMEYQANNPSNNSTHKFSPQFYEQMLKTAATHPERLEDIDDLMGRLDKENIPEDFEQMYSRFKSIIHKLKKL